MSPEFRQGEIVRDIKLICTECGKKAQGNHSWTDGSGEMCDECAANDGLPLGLATYLIGFQDMSDVVPSYTVAYIDATSEKEAVKVVKRWDTEGVLALPLSHSAKDCDLLQAARAYYIAFPENAR